MWYGLTCDVIKGISTCGDFDISGFLPRFRYEPREAKDVVHSQRKNANHEACGADRESQSVLVSNSGTTAANCAFIHWVQIRDIIVKSAPPMKMI